MLIGKVKQLVRQVCYNFGMKSKNKGTKKEEVKEITNSEVEMKDASVKTDKYGTYRGETLISLYTKTNHGKDFKKIAEAHAKRDGLEVKPVVETPKDAEPVDTVTIVGPDQTQVMRVFSKETHGEDYESLAENFIEKHGKAKGFTIKVKKEVVVEEETED